MLHSGNRLDIAGMTDAVVAGALTVAVLNAVPGVLGGWLWLGWHLFVRGDWR